MNTTYLCMLLGDNRELKRNIFTAWVTIWVTFWVIFWVTLWLPTAKELSLFTIEQMKRVFDKKQKNCQKFNEVLIFEEICYVSKTNLPLA